MKGAKRGNSEKGEKGKKCGQSATKREREWKKETEAHVHCFPSHYVQECTSYLSEKVLGCQRQHHPPRQYEMAKTG